MAQTISVQASLAFGTAGSAFKAEQSIQLGANANQFISTTAGAAGGPGWFMVLTSANDTVQYSPDAGTTWRTAVAASSFGLFYSNGQTWRLHNTGVADAGGVVSILTQIDII